MSSTNKDCGFEVRAIGQPIGKGLFAIKDFKEKDVIFEETPLVSCQFLWNSTYGYLACEFCMRPMETSEENARRLSGIPNFPLPHQECCQSNNPGVSCQYCQVPYCSQECRQIAWNQYHETLCLRSPMPDPNHPITQLQETWKQMHYPPETACVMLLAKILACVKQAKDKEAVVARFMQFCHQTINEEEEIAHKLLGTEFEAQLETLRSLMKKIFSNEDFNYHWLTPDGFKSLFALVGTNGQGIGTSPLGQWVKNCDELSLAPLERDLLDKCIDDLYEKIEEESGIFLNTEGSGLFDLQSACNHSCDPNATATFPYNNFRICVKALKDINAGDEICISYLDECNLNRSRHSRVKILRENYLFTCHCSKCESQMEEPDVTSEEEMDDDEDEDSCAD